MTMDYECWNVKSLRVYRYLSRIDGEKIGFEFVQLFAGHTACVGVVQEVRPDCPPRFNFGMQQLPEGSRFR
jgi:hypothetical protein